MGIHQREHLLAIFRIDQFVLIIQYKAQHFAIDCLVIYDQHQSLTIGGMKFYMAIQHIFSFAFTGDQRSPYL